MFIFLILFLLGAGAWAFGTIAAGGAATIMLPILGLYLGIDIAIPAIAVASLIANQGRAFIFRHHIDWKISSWLIPGTIMGGIVGGYSFSILPVSILQLLTGAFLIFLAKPAKTFNVIKPWKVQQFLPLGFFVSFLSGIMGGSGPILNPFFIRYGAAKESIVATKSLNSLLMQIVKLIIYGFTGHLLGLSLECGIAVGIGAIIGTLLGKKHLIRIDDAQFKRYTMLLLLLAGSILMAKGILALL